MTIYRFGNGGGGPEGGLPGSAGGGPAGGREGGMGGGSAPRLGGGGILEGVPGATGVLAPPVGVEVPDDCCDDPRRISAGLYNKTQSKRILFIITTSTIGCQRVHTCLPKSVESEEGA